MPAIQEISIDNNRPLLKITFFRGIVLHIRYNDYDEYSYQLNFSQEPDDRLRFDNYDAKWFVSTRPHHYHPRGKKMATESPMNGDPQHDIPILIKYIPIST